MMDFSNAVVTEYGVVIIDNGDEYISIPPDPANSDYQLYLASLEA